MKIMFCERDTFEYLMKGKLILFTTSDEGKRVFTHKHTSILCILSVCAVFLPSFISDLVLVYTV
jgi:hypothetical protein